MAGSISDITEEKQLAEGLEQARRQLSEAIETISEGFVLFDAEERLVLCNETYRRYYADAAGDEVANLVAPGSSYGEILRAAFEHGMFPGITLDLDRYLERRRKQRARPGTPDEFHLSSGVWLQGDETAGPMTVGWSRSIRTSRRPSNAKQSSTRCSTPSSTGSASWGPT